MDDWYSRIADARLGVARARIEALRAEAARERLARSGASRRPIAGLRQTVGGWLTQLGAAIAGSLESTHARRDALDREERWTARC